MFQIVPYSAECAEGKALFTASRSSAALHKASLSPIGLSPEHRAYQHHLHTCPLCLHRNQHPNEQPLAHKLTA